MNLVTTVQKLGKQFLTSANTYVLKPVGITLLTLTSLWTGYTLATFPERSDRRAEIRTPSADQQLMLDSFNTRILFNDNVLEYSTTNHLGDFIYAQRKHLPEKTQIEFISKKMSGRPFLAQASFFFGKQIAIAPHPVLTNNIPTVYAKIFNRDLFAHEFGHLLIHVAGEKNKNIVSNLETIAGKENYARPEEWILHYSGMETYTPEKGKTQSEAEKVLQEKGILNEYGALNIHEGSSEIREFVYKSTFDWRRESLKEVFSQQNKGNNKFWQTVDSLEANNVLFPGTKNIIELIISTPTQFHNVAFKNYYTPQQVDSIHEEIKQYLESHHTTPYKSTLYRTLGDAVATTRPYVAKLTSQQNYLARKQYEKSMQYYFLALQTAESFADANAAVIDLEVAAGYTYNEPVKQQVKEVKKIINENVKRLPPYVYTSKPAIDSIMQKYYLPLK